MQTVTTVGSLDVSMLIVFFHFPQYFGIVRTKLPVSVPQTLIQRQHSETKIGWVKRDCIQSSRKQYCLSTEKSLEKVKMCVSKQEGNTASTCKSSTELIELTSSDMQPLNKSLAEERCYLHWSEETILICVFIWVKIYTLSNISHFLVHHYLFNYCLSYHLIFVSPK